MANGLKLMQRQISEISFDTLIIEADSRPRSAAVGRLL